MIYASKNFWSFEPILVEIWELLWKKYFFHPRVPPLVFKCFGRHVSARGRVLFAKKRHGLLDKSSLFDPWIHPLSAKKDLSTLKFNIYATIVSTPVQLELGIRKPLITRGTFGGWGNILSFIIFIFWWLSKSRLDNRHFFLFTQISFPAFQAV